MKRYTTQEQTSKLKELGFADPADLHPIESGDEKFSVCTMQRAYELAELIEMLPQLYKQQHDEYEGKKFYDTYYLSITPDDSDGSWFVVYSEYNNNEDTALVSNQAELIDAVYEMIIELKEKKLI